MEKWHGGPAFPTTEAVVISGMTLRDYFAGQALAGLTGNVEMLLAAEDPRLGRKAELTIAASCYVYADAMLGARDGS